MYFRATMNEWKLLYLPDKASHGHSILNFYSQGWMEHYFQMIAGTWFFYWYKIGLNYLNWVCVMHFLPGYLNIMAF
jgi:hypothetical protein